MSFTTAVFCCLGFVGHECLMGVFADGTDLSYGGLIVMLGGSGWLGIVIRTNFGIHL